MKAFGSIRRLASSLRNPTRKASISPATSTNSAPEENIPSTSEPLDLSIPTKRPSSTQPNSPKKIATKKSKRALADVLETLYNRLQTSPSSTTPTTTTTSTIDKMTNENSSTTFHQHHQNDDEKIVEELPSKEQIIEKNLSYQVSYFNVLCVLFLTFLFYIFSKIINPK